MASIKEFDAQHPAGTRGLTVYAVIEQLNTGFYLDDADGGFAADPADRYQEVAEDAIQGGLYHYSESRMAWADGNYRITFYAQLGVSPAPLTDAVFSFAAFRLVGDSVPSEESSVTIGMCSLADVKTQLNLTVTDKDQLCTDLIAAAEKMIQNKTGYTLIATDFTEYFSPGNRGGNVSSGLGALRVHEHPVISVASVHQDDAREWGSGALVAAADYFHDTLRIYLYGTGVTQQFTGGQRTVRAIYRAGYETIPADLRRACVMMAAHLYYKADRQRQNIASESMGDATVTYLDQAMPKEVVELLKPYTRPCGL